MSNLPWRSKNICVFSNFCSTNCCCSISFKIVTSFLNGFPFTFQFIAFLIIEKVFCTFFYKTAFSSLSLAESELYQKHLHFLPEQVLCKQSLQISRQWQEFFFILCILSSPYVLQHSNQSFRRQTISQSAVAELKFSGIISAGVIAISNSS